MEKVLLKAAVREEQGKIFCKHLRKSGQVPGIVYKDGKEGLKLQVENKDLWHALHTDAGENAIITLDIFGEKSSQKTVIVQFVQTDPINDKFIHVDFREISLKDKLKVNVPISIKGEAKGVVEEDGVLNQVIWEIEVECLPTDIPEHIDVHVNDLEMNDSIHIKDLTPLEGVEFLGDPEQVIVGVNPPKEEEEVVEEAVEGEEGVEPEVIKKGKKEEEEGAEGEEGAEPAEKKEAPSGEEG